MRPGRIIHGLATAIIAIVLVMNHNGVEASHQFSDVATGNFFHNAVGNIASAGCASGYNDGTFRPDSNPTRGQFAYWTHNCGGRIDYDQGDIVSLGTTNTFVGQVSVTAGAVDNPLINTGGYVWFNAALEATNNTGGDSTDCEVLFRLYRGSGQVEIMYLDLAGDQLFNDHAGAMNRVDSISAGQTIAYTVRVERLNCEPIVGIEAGLTAMYVPFDGAGNGGGAAGALAESEIQPEPERPTE